MQSIPVDTTGTLPQSQPTVSTLSNPSSQDLRVEMQSQEITKLTRQADELKQMLAKKEAEVLELLSYVEEIMKTPSS